MSTIAAHVPSLPGRRSSARGLSTTQRHSLRAAHHIATLFDSRFRIFGFRFGLDPIIGFIPVIGDFVSIGVGVYMMLVALHLRLPLSKVLQIAALEGTDFLVGLVPFAGDIADAILKADIRSLRIIEEHVRQWEGEIEAGRRTS